MGSSTDLIAQRVEFVHESDKRSHLLDLLHAQRSNGVQGKVYVLYLTHHCEDSRGFSFFFFFCYLNNCFSYELISMTCASINLIFLG